MLIYGMPHDLSTELGRHSESRKRVLQTMTTKNTETCEILDNRRLQGDYHQIDLRTSQIAGMVEPGQFVHVRIPQLEHRVLRRPFSVYDVDPGSGRLSIVYKIVGEGTAHMSNLEKGIEMSVLGPLGHGFTVPQFGQESIIVAGGYGCAATYLLAKRSERPPLVLIGGRSDGDLLLLDEFRAQGCEVRISTDDGSAGHQGVVTELLKQELDERGLEGRPVFACGPDPMLRAVWMLAEEGGFIAELSLDHAMCCGVGACFACVVKVKADTEDGWRYARTCLEGPVFNSDQAVWD